MKTLPKKIVGVLLVNVGSPDAPTPRDVARYLAKFLSDPRVIDIPYFFRMLLLYFFILPFRSFQSARLYKNIWSKRGSPLIALTQDLGQEVSKKCGEGYVIKIAMRYRKPSLQTAVHELQKIGVEKIIVFPLFPQYASASTGTVLEQAGKIINSSARIPSVVTIPAFYNETAFISAISQIVQEEIKNFAWDFILFSYHGLPERQIKKSDLTLGQYCLAHDNCCSVLNHENKFCYRFQCFETSRQLANILKLSDEQHCTAFQSRLGRTVWIRPYTDIVLQELAQKGIRRLVIACPSFVTDCLETLEEIGIRAREQWQSLGGEELKLVSCLNSHPLWVDFVAERIKAYGSV